MSAIELTIAAASDAAGFNPSAVAVAAAFMVGLALVLAAVLLAADRYLRVAEDPRIDRIEDVLPAANCGACGFPGCRAYAENVAKGLTPPDKCAPGGADVAERVAAIVGAETERKESRYAVVHCGCPESKKVRQAVYDGPKTCSAADWTGGEGACKFGCLAYGDCFDACPFGAIEMADGLPVVDIEKCTGCGACAKACPRGLITLEKFAERDGKLELAYVACSSKDRGPVAKKVCPVSCIGCKSCSRLFEDVFKIEDNLAAVDYGTYDYNAGDYTPAAEKCPTGCILIAK